MADGERPAGLSFEEARERLRARGYLDRGVEGAVLRGALAARSRARGLFAAAAIASAFLASALAAVQTLLVAVASALPAGDAFVLFLWLLVGALAVAAILVGLLMLGAWLRSRGRTDGEVASTEAGLAVGLLSGAIGAAAAIPVLEGAGTVGTVEAWAVLLLVAGSVFVSVRVARSVTATVLLVAGRDLLLRRRKGAVVALALSVFLLAGGALALALRPGGSPPEEPLVVTSLGTRVVVVGVDGWSDALLPAGHRPPPEGLRYVKESRDPAAFWTTVATGEPPARHGVGALDLIRVAGVGTPIQPVAGTRWLLGRLLTAAGLSHRESVTSASRRVPAAWEIAARAGAASLAVGWWTTYPATGGAATVLSNHLYFAARARGSLAGEGWPPEAAARAAGRLPRLAPAAGGARLLRDAVGIDAFHRAAFGAEYDAARPRLSFVYLPGPDILSAALSSEGKSAAERVDLAEALRVETLRLAEFLEEVPARTGASLAVLVLDGGRAADGGRVVLLGPLSRPATGELRIEDLAPTVLAALGIPSSREAVGRVRPDLLVSAAWDGRTVASWGRRPKTAPSGIDPKEYVQNLRSLGYLQ